jgi:hypothetical protein
MLIADVDTRVEEFMAYMHDFHDANGEWPSRNDYADFLGKENSRALPGVRAAINRGLVGYMSGDRLAPREVAIAEYEEWRAAQNTESTP